MVPDVVDTEPPPHVTARIIFALFAVPTVRFVAVPVAFVRTTADGVPRLGVVSVGEVANTSDPEPVSSVTAVAMLVLDGVARAVATPVPRPDTPVEIGRPVPFVSVTEVGVPRIGVTRVGEVERTLLPDPVDDVTPVPPLATGSVPVTPVVRGNPVAFVSVAADGVPRFGVTSVGLFDRTTFVVPVEEVTPVPPLATGSVPVTPVVSGKPVRFVATPDDGVPRAGVTKVGEFDRTLFPEPVDVVTPVPPFATGNVPVTPVVSGNPVPLVSVTEAGVPSVGVVRTGEVEKTRLVEVVPVAPDAE